jgi:DHA3 family macrolide efflux protein-like MFS transporter
MTHIFRSRPLRLLFAANSVSMVGSGMNSAAVIWYLLQATHSEQLLGALVVAQAIPSLLLMPFSGVIVDREDRRHVVMALDGARAVLIVTVAILALRGALQVWHLFLMSVLVSTGFWMFWPTITALLQELTPETQFAESNAMLLAGFQGGWLVAGAIVGFVYNKIGIGGILLFDFLTYVFSLTCYFSLRKGRHRVAHHHSAPHVAHPLQRFAYDMREGFSFVSSRRSLALIGMTWALFVAAMMVTGVVTAPTSDRLLHAGAIGYGWMNAGWGIGAFLSTFVAARMIRNFGWRVVVPACMLLISASFYGVPYSGIIWIAAGLYFIGGVARGVGGVALSTGIMDAVPKQFMGRVQTLFSIGAIVLQVSLAPLVGHVAQTISLTLAVSCVGSLYLLASASGFISARNGAAETVAPQPETPSMSSR